MKRNFLTILMTGALLIASNSHGALAGSQDEEFLAIIRAAVEGAAPNIQEVKASYADETLIDGGQAICSDMDKLNGDIKAMIEGAVINNPKFQALSEAEQEAEATFYGIVMVAATETYCTQYKDAVEAFVKS